MEGYELIMKGKRTGVWLIGALGSISTTVITGAVSLRRKLIPPGGMVTSTEAFEGLGLVDTGDLVFGGCDVREGSLVEAARHVLRETSADPRILGEIEEDLREVEQNIRTGTTRNCGEAIERLACFPAAHRHVREEIEGIRECLRHFKSSHSLSELVVVNLASTEPPLALMDCHSDIDSFEAALDRSDVDAVRASTIYAYAAIQEGCPYINFTPSSGALLPAVIQLAERKGVPVMGNDGKTGETLVKSALAPMFVSRNLEVLSWQGFNILGNMDGRVLDHPDNQESKIKTKDRVLSKILGYTPHSRVRIDFVPSLDDQKTAWDFIHFRGFLGAKMSLQFIWQGYDSILAAPLVLDLVRLAEFAKSRGESGLMPHLASYFKAPVGVEEYSLHEQFRMLMKYVKRVKEE
jgi:myo-inositol-1-phosphate synthase